MTTSVEDEELVQTDPIERRRMQNRHAQRKFRIRRNQQRQYQAAAQAALDFSLNDQNPLTQPLTYNAWNDAKKLPYTHYGLPVHDTTLGVGQVHVAGSAAFCSPELAVNGTNMSDFGYAASDPEIMTQPYLSNLPIITSGAASDAITIELPHATPWEPNSAPPSATFVGTDRGSVHLSKSQETRAASVLNTGSQYPISPRRNDFQHSLNEECTTISSRRAPSSAGSSQIPHVRSNSTSSASSLRSNERHQDRDSARAESEGMGYTNNANDWLLSLHIASYRGHAAIVQVLLERDVDVNERDSNSRTALHQATMKGHVPVVKVLLQHGADINAVDKKGHTALHWAALEKNEEMLRLLIDAGAEVNLVDHNGWTPLHAAVERGFEAGLRLLLRHGADLSIRARKCDTWKRSEPNP